MNGKRKLFAIVLSVLALLAIVSSVGATGNRPGDDIFYPQWVCSSNGYHFYLDRDGTIDVINDSDRDEVAQKANVFINGEFVDQVDVPAVNANNSAYNFATVSTPGDAGFTWKVEGQIDCASHGSHDPVEQPQPEFEVDVDVYCVEGEPGVARWEGKVTKLEGTLSNMQPNPKWTNQSGTWDVDDNSQQTVEATAWFEKDGGTEDITRRKTVSKPDCGEPEPPEEPGDWNPPVLGRCPNESNWSAWHLDENGSIPTEDSWKDLGPGWDGVNHPSPNVWTQCYCPTEDNEETSTGYATHYVAPDSDDPRWEEWLTSNGFTKMENYEEGRWNLGPAPYGMWFRNDRWNCQEEEEEGHRPGGHGALCIAPGITVEWEVIGIHYDERKVDDEEYDLYRTSAWAIGDDKGNLLVGYDTTYTPGKIEVVLRHRTSGELLNMPMHFLNNVMQWQPGDNDVNGMMAAAHQLWNERINMRDTHGNLMWLLDQNWLCAYQPLESPEGEPGTPCPICVATVSQCLLDKGKYVAVHNHWVGRMNNDAGTPLVFDTEAEAIAAGLEWAGSECGLCARGLVNTDNQTVFITEGADPTDIAMEMNRLDGSPVPNYLHRHMEAAELSLLNWTRFNKEDGWYSYSEAQFPESETGTESSSEFTYTVQAGDTMYDILLSHGYNMQQAHELVTSDVSYSRVLHVNDVLTLPSAPSSGESSFQETVVFANEGLTVTAFGLIESIDIFALKGDDEYTTTFGAGNWQPTEGEWTWTVQWDTGYEDYISITVNYLDGSIGTASWEQTTDASVEYDVEAELVTIGSNKLVDSVEITGSSFAGTDQTVMYNNVDDFSSSDGDWTDTVVYSTDFNETITVVFNFADGTNTTVTWTAPNI